MTNTSDTTVRGITVAGTNKTSFAPQAFSAPELPEFTIQRRTDGIAGYTFNAENYSPENLVEELIQRGQLSPGARGMVVEDALNQLAEIHTSGLDEDDPFDRDDEYTFDSDDFPKIITEQQVEISDHPALGREYWDTPEYDDEPRTADSALQEWIDTQEIDFLELAEAHAASTGETEPHTPEAWDELADSMREGLFQFTDRTSNTAEQNIEAIREGAQYMGFNLDKYKSPLPTRHN
jgi:hypothetical protein